MYTFDTPTKGLPCKTTSLRQQIESKLLTDKKILNTKQDIYTKYQSHTKNVPQTNFCHNLTKDNIKLQNKQLLTKKEHFSSFSSNQNIIFLPQITQSNILEFQSLENRSFYGFDEWLEFNKKFFSHVGQQCVKNLWKIMRTINYGDIWIPSGLIYEVSKILISKENGERSCLKQVFNQFLKFNHASDQVNNFRELQKFQSFEEIEQTYLKIKPKQKPSSIKKVKQYSSLKKLPQNSDVFQRVFNESKIRNERKNQNIYKGLIQKQIDEQCVFKPKINEYCPQKLFIDENLRPSRSCYSKQKWMTERFDVNTLTETREFKATPFQRSRFQNKSLDEIPGVAQYFDRKRASQAQKRKLERYKQKPTSVYRHD